MKNLSYLIGFVVMAGICFACSQPETYRETSGQLHTSYHIKYKYNKDLTPEIDEKLKLFYHIFNAFDSTSVISQVNRNEIREVTDDIFLKALRTAQQIAVYTEGAYDITCAPLINLWGFGYNNQDSVSPEHIDSVKAFVGFEKLQIEKKQIIKADPRMQLNCSSLADGTVCDMIADLFDSKGINHYMIEFGGEIAAKGINPKGSAWKIGINKPSDDKEGINQELECIVQYQPEQTQKTVRFGMATSGNYRNFYIKDGKRYAHTIDPKLGAPVQKDVLSATIIAPSGMIADACATACMVLGSQGAAQLKEKLPEIEYYLICTGDSIQEYRIVESDGFNRFKYNSAHISSGQAN